MSESMQVNGVTINLDREGYLLDPDQWNEDVAKSGFGGRHEDSKAGVHRVAKYRWALPILIRDSPNFADLYAVYRQLYEGDQEKMMWFVDEQIHTETMSVSQVAEFLSEFQNYYSGHGVALTDPDLKLLEAK